MIKRTYIDADVLINAFRGREEPGSNPAFQILDDPERELVLSDYLRLEVIPKPAFYKRNEEFEFMQDVFDHASQIIPSSPELTRQAIDLALKYGMGAMDALHVSAAVVAVVDELITMEKSSSPMCRVQEIRVVSIRSVPEAT